MATTGFGDIKTMSPACRLLSSLQMITGFMLVTFFLGLFVTRFGELRQSAGREPR